MKNDETPKQTNGNVPGGEGFSRLANNFSAGILTDFKGILCRPGGKRTVVWACCHFSNKA
ncbi:MAG: hypothetical protein HFF17_03670 [Oscillospiraceae bacterium]|nr:hypothetical protein [Oscillospiraceae bacterium]